MSLFTKTGDVKDPAVFKTACDALIASLPETITADQFPVIVARINAIFSEHVPVIDQRRTPDEVKQNNEKIEAVHQQIAATSKAFRDEFCKPDLVEIPAGMMAVYLEMTFDDSNMMVDYFQPHVPIGDKMLLAIVPKQAEKELVARKALAKYPVLEKLSWSWHTENYSMGHGNYLISACWGSRKRRAYDGREEVNVCWEIRMSAYERTMYAYKDYPGVDPARDTSQNAAPAAGNTTDGVSITRNVALNGIEVKFESKPMQTVIDTLRTLGFRWSPRNMLWYAKYSDDLMSKVCLKMGIPEMVSA